MRFCHLRLKTEFSLLSSMLTINEIVSFGKHNQSLALCVMDDINLSAGFDFSTQLAKANIKPLIGININIINDIDGNIYNIGFIAKNANGYSNMLKILYHINFNSNTIIKAIKLEELSSYTNDLICITGGTNGIIRHNIINGNKNFAKNIAVKLKELFSDNIYLELTRHGLKNERQIEDEMLNISRELKIPLVATNDVHFYKKEQFNAFDVLSCIKNKTVILDDNRNTLNPEYYLKTEEEMISLFDDIPEAIENTLEIAKRCSFMIKYGEPRLPSFISEQNFNEEELILEKTKTGLIEKIKHNATYYVIDTEKYFARLEYELSILKKMNFFGYFLIVADFVQFAKKNNISVGPGRGSGAGCIVAWALDITDVDPIKYGLFFERFLNPERVSMPDFDIDFCQRRRSEVIEYVKNKYGINKVANIVTYGKLNAKAVLKDVGRVLQIPYNKIDEICKLIPFNPLEPVTIEKAIKMDPRLKSEREENIEIQQLIDIAMDLEGLNRHSSIHAAGIVISDVDIKDIAPVDKPEDDNNIQILLYNLKDAEKIGFVKFDFLGLKTLTLISDTCQFIKNKYNIDLNISKISVNDKKTFELLRSTNLHGIFQFEATIPRITLQQINADKIEDLVAVTALSRPGPMDQLPRYIKRRIGEEVIDSYHPALKEALNLTCGIIVFQEQVSQVVQILADYSMGEADLVRRAMGKKIKEEMDAQKDIFIQKAIKKGIIDKKKAIEMFDIISRFAGYGFNIAHATSYAMISYQTAYLKANYKLEFFISSLNLEMDNTDKLNLIIIDVKKFGIKILPPSINESNVYFKDENDSIRYGLGSLKAVGEKLTQEICIEREKNGKFKDLTDFLKRCNSLINKKNLESFIKSGTFDVFKINRKTLLENILKILDFNKNLTDLSTDNQINLFGEQNISNIKLKEYPDFSYEEKIKNEFEAIGFYLLEHPLEKYKEKLYSAGIKNSSEISTSINNNKEKNVFMCGVITKVIQRFKKNKRFAFIHLLDFEGSFETMIFNDDLITNHRDNLIEGNSIVISVNVKNIQDSGGIRIMIKEIYDVQNFIKSTDSNKFNINNNTGSKREIKTEKK